MVKAPRVDNATINRVRRNTATTGTRGTLTRFKSPTGGSRTPAGKGTLTPGVRPTATPPRLYPNPTAPAASAGPSRYSQLRGGVKRVRQHPATRVVGRYTGRGLRAGRKTALPHVRRATGGVGAILVLFIGLGVAVAIIRNPKFITEPLSFITGAGSALAGLTGPSPQKAKKP